MRVRVQDQVLFLHTDDAPPFKKGGPIVRNSYFWALKSIAGRAQRGKDWEFETDVWFALQRMLLSFMESGYLGLRETQLEFPVDAEIPPLLRSVATWQAEAEILEAAEPEDWRASPSMAEDSKSWAAPRYQRAIG